MSLNPHEFASALSAVPSDSDTKSKSVAKQDMLSESPNQMLCGRCATTHNPFQHPHLNGVKMSPYPPRCHISALFLSSLERRSPTGASGDCSSTVGGSIPFFWTARVAFFSGPESPENSVLALV